MIHSVAERLGVDWDEAERAAGEAAARGWLTIEGRHSVCLTEDGRRLGGEGIMSDGMPVDMSPAEMFTLQDPETVRLQLPLLPIAGLAEPLRIHLDFDAASVDELLERLTLLRAQMLPLLRN